MNTRLLAVSLLAATALLSCESNRARIMADTDQDLVGTRSAGAPTFDRLISSVVDRLLRLHSAARGGLGKLKVVVLDVENASSEELGDWQDQIYALMTTSINRSERYTNVSKRFVDAALKETRLRPEDLFIPGKRRAFLDVLEMQGSPVDAMVFPKLTTGTTAGDDLTQRNYSLTLEMVDVQTGWQDQVISKPLRKEYR